MYRDEYSQNYFVVSSAEMPTSGDLKSGDCLFFTTPPPHPQKMDPAPNGND